LERPCEIRRISPLRLIATQTCVCFSFINGLTEFNSMLENSHCLACFIALKRLFIRCLVAFFLSVILAPAILAQDKSNLSLVVESSGVEIGENCPPIRAERVLKGEAISALQADQVYVIEFWASWCGPCVEAMPHMKSLEREFSERGVEFISVNVREMRRAGDVWEETFDKASLLQVKKFVQENEEWMPETVLYDGQDKSIDNAWLGATRGVPTVFVIDREGKVAWIGHPLMLRLPLESIVVGKWDLSSDPSKVQEVSDMFFKSVQMIAANSKQGLEAWSKAEVKFPKLAEDLIGKKFDALITAGAVEGAIEVGDVYFEKASKDRDIRALNRIGWSIIDPDSPLEKRDLELALRATTRANEFAHGKYAIVHETLAQIYFLQGKIDAAIESQLTAIELSGEPSIKRRCAMLRKFILALKQ
jgi:thiol-disulfide isomerase/thioredoxin